MPAMHEWESRMRHVEETLNHYGDLLMKLSDQIGQVQQNQQMNRSTPGAGSIYKLARVAKTGGTAIAAMSGSTPGSGTVTLYDTEDFPMTAGDTATAYNLHPTETVSANAWIKVIRVGKKWFCFWEPCA